MVVVQKTEKHLVLKCALTGLIYAVLTCIIQVPVASALFFILGMEPSAPVSDEMLPWLLLSIFVVGSAMAWFYYREGWRFEAGSRLRTGALFGLFVYFSNYIPQVLFLDAGDGFLAFITGGFPIVQVELFDFAILMLTVLLMVLFIPVREPRERAAMRAERLWPCLLCGAAFALVIVVLNELLLPLVGVPGIAQNLHVAPEHEAFFYGVMIAGFVMAGSLVSCSALRNGESRLCLEYGALIWCAFDLTMIPLGFGALSTICFIAVSLIAFACIGGMCRCFRHPRWGCRRG